MEETTVTKETFYKIPTTGRKEIISSYKEVNEQNIYNVINYRIMFAMQRMVLWYFYITTSMP